MKRRVSIYQVFPRVYSKEGKLNNVTKDMKRIADMGFDYLYLLPIHPIGKIGRKGSLGSPYSIADYLSVDRSAMMREMKLLKEDGIIEKSGNRIKLIYK